MKAHTLEGGRITHQIEGFRQYLGVAEEDRLVHMLQEMVDHGLRAVGPRAACAALA